MIPVPVGVRVWLASGVTDMRRGMNGLTLRMAALIQTLASDTRSYSISALQPFFTGRT
jgi:hypothetical protein